jgi:hypothetical protein
VRAALERFPRARIVEVRPPSADVAPPPAEPGPDWDPFEEG